MFARAAARRWSDSTAESAAILGTIGGIDGALARVAGLDK